MIKSNQPKLNIEATPVDMLIESAGIVFILLMIGLAIYYYGKLPDEIPTRFGFDGQPTDFSAKGTIWLMPILGTIMYIVLAIINQFPHTFNYLRKITPDNARRQYTLATRFIRLLNTSIALIFAMINYSIINSALGNQDGMTVWLLPAILIVVFLPLGIYLYKSTRKENI